MDFTVLLVGLLIGIGIPIRNKAIKEYRKRRSNYTWKNIFWK